MRFHFIEALLTFPNRHTNIDRDMCVPLCGDIGMVDLGFTIIHPCDEHFQARIRDSTPRDNVPDVAAAEAEEIAEAHMRYSCLIGIAPPCDEAEMAAWTTDALTHPDLADSGHFIYQDAERLMEQWSGVGRQAVRAYLYEELVTTAACGLMLCPGDSDPDEEYCRDLIIMHHARWLREPGL